MRLPETKLSVAVTCNFAESDPTQLAHQVLDLVLNPNASSASSAPEGAAESAPSSAQTSVGPVIQPEQYVGVYFSHKERLVRNLSLRDGKLFYVRGGGRDNELGQTADGKLTMINVPFQSSLSFEKRDSKRYLLLNTDNGLTEFEQMTAPVLNAASLNAIAGDYFSSELDVSWTLQVKDGALQLHLPRDPAMVFEAPFTDAFTAQGTLLTLTRDKNKEVIGFSIDAGRARNIRFIRRAH